MISLSASNDDGATQPLGHGQFSFEGIMIDDKMFKEFHDVIVAELFFVDINSGCSDASHVSLLF